MTFGMKKPSPDDGNSLHPVRYRFLRPARLRIRRLDGRTVMEGFGIGEVIVVMEPRIQFMIPARERLTEIEMPGGTFVVEWPEDIAVERVHT